MNDLLQQIEAVVREAGARLLAAEDAAVTEKDGIGNFVTDQDIATQKFLYKKLGELLPDARFVGEEDEEHGETPDGRCIIIDPIDGTANFIRGANYSAISVGIVENGVPTHGVVYNPWSAELYRAEKGKGAFLNDRPIRVSDKPLEKGIAVVGFTSYARDLNERQFGIFRRLFDACQDLRCLGSAALDICGVAAGRWESFTELRLMPWDYAAAQCILQEAGGILTTVDGTDAGFSGETSILAASETCYADVLACCRGDR